MRKSASIAALCALWIAGVSTSPAICLAETITVIHGTVTETFDTTKEPAGGVHLIRLASKPPATMTPVAEIRATRPQAMNETYVAGDTLWTRNTRTGRLTACFVGSSGKVGKSVIRCTGPDAFGR
ncbi:MAG: hypothetical protein O3C34_19650 [Proteobacteria bacterium]|nr:hypothetical protein [Pseudomonadota bacterium]